MVSYLNISAVRSEDGGLYTCKAANSLGEVSHTSRLNIYGKQITQFSYDYEVYLYIKFYINYFFTP